MLNISQVMAYKVWTGWYFPATAADRGHFLNPDNVKNDDGIISRVQSYTSWGKVKTTHNFPTQTREIYTIQADVEGRRTGWFAWGKISLIVKYVDDEQTVTWQSSYVSFGGSYSVKTVSVDLNGANYNPQDLEYYIRVSKSVIGDVDIDYIKIRVQYDI